MHLEICIHLYTLFTGSLLVVIVSGILNDGSVRVSAGVPVSGSLIEAAISTWIVLYHLTGDWRAVDVDFETDKRGLRVGSSEPGWLDHYKTDGDA